MEGKGKMTPLEELLARQSLKLWLIAMQMNQIKITKIFM